MTETPETPTPSIAERLDEDAAYWRNLHTEQPQRPGYDWMIELADRESAAAAQLRQLDRIKAAYMAVRGEHLATSRPFRADCDNDKCYQLVRDLIEELDALEVDDGT